MQKFLCDFKRAGISKATAKISPTLHLASNGNRWRFQKKKKKVPIKSGAQHCWYFGYQNLLLGSILANACAFDCQIFWLALLKHTSCIVIILRMLAKCEVLAQIGFPCHARCTGENNHLETDSK